MKKVSVAIIGGINVAAGLEKHLRMRELSEVEKRTMLILQEVLIDAVLDLREKCQGPCVNSFREAKFQG